MWVAHVRAASALRSSIGFRKHRDAKKPAKASSSAGKSQELFLHPNQTSGRETAFRWIILTVGYEKSSRNTRGKSGPAMQGTRQSAFHHQTANYCTDTMFSGSYDPEPVFIPVRWYFFSPAYGKTETGKTCNTLSLKNRLSFR